MRATKKETDAIMECYSRLYANADPKADFNALMKVSPKNEEGQIEIPYMDYSINKKVYNKIVSEVIKEYGIRSSFRISAFKATIALGCSPKFKK